MIRVFLLFFALFFGLGWSQGIQDLRFQQALELVRQNRLDAALQEYKAILLDNPENADAYVGVARIQTRQGKWNAAAKNYQQALQYRPDSKACLAELAEVYEKNHQQEKAVATWRKLADKGSAQEKASAEARIRKLLGVDDSQVGADSLSVNAPAPARSASANPSSVKDKLSSKGTYHYDLPEYLAGIQAYQKGDWKQALTQWRQVLRKEPGHPGAYYFAGVCRYNLNDLDKAAYNLKRGFEYPDKGFNAHYYLGRIYERQNQISKAQQHYRAYLKRTKSSQGRAEVEKRLAALNKQPQTPPPQQEKTDSVAKDSSSISKERFVAFDQGWLLALGEPQWPAAKALTEAVKSAQQKSYPAAIDSLKAIRRDYPSSPSSLAASYNLAVLYHYLGLSDHVQTLVQNTLSSGVKEPWLSSLNYLLANALVMAKQPQTAQPVLESVQTGGLLGPTKTQKMQLSSQIASMLKAEKDVPDLLEKAIANELDPVKKKTLQYQLGQTYLGQNMTANARKVWMQLVSDCPEQAAKICLKGYYALGDLNYQEKQYQKALNFYQKVVEKYSESEESVWGLYQTGNCFRKMRQYDQAIKAYQKVSDQYPENYWAEQAKWNREDVIWTVQNARILGKD